MSDKHIVPKHLDDPELIGLWTLDEFLAMIVPFSWGILTQHIFPRSRARHGATAMVGNTLAWRAHPKSRGKFICRRIQPAGCRRVRPSGSAIACSGNSAVTAATKAATSPVSNAPLTLACAKAGASSRIVRLV